MAMKHTSTFLFIPILLPHSCPCDYARQEDGGEDESSRRQAVSTGPSLGRITGSVVQKWVRQVTAQHGIADEDIVGAVTDVGGDVRVCGEDVVVGVVPRSPSQPRHGGRDGHVAGPGEVQEQGRPGCWSC